MKTTLLASALALTLVSGTSFASDGSEQFPQPSGAQKTRAEVRAEVIQARAAGTLVLNDFPVQTAAAQPSPLSRAEVRASTAAAVANGELLAVNRDGYQPPAMALRSGRTGTSLR